MDYKIKKTLKASNSLSSQLRLRSSMVKGIALLTCLGGASKALAGVVALTILAESRGEGRNGMAAVAAVISQRSLNRSLSPREVCIQKFQFSCWNGKKESDLQHLYKSKMAPWALYLEANILNINRKKIHNADHYYSTIISTPYWAKGKKPVSQIGKHKFYRLRTKNK